MENYNERRNEKGGGRKNIQGVAIDWAVKSKYGQGDWKRHK